MLSPHVRGHLLLYDRPAASGLGRETGVRLLLITLAMVLADILVQWQNMPMSWLFASMVARLLLIGVLVRYVARIGWSAVGIKPFGRWSVVERSFLAQMAITVNVLFPLVQGQLQGVPIATVYASVFLGGGYVFYFVFGVVQEVVYRGLLQTELTRRWGAAAGVAVANSIYTFGPLHADYYFREPSVALSLFGATFAVGLLFSLHFHRSRNLWIVALMHGWGLPFLNAAHDLAGA